jgi:holo-[acyl-carrier protein] synthase
VAIESDGVVASALEVLEIDEVEPLLAGSEAFTPEERAYAASKVDPHRRLAARLAAKRAAVRLLGGDVTLADIEVVRDGPGPPRLRFSKMAAERLLALGASHALVSLTHERSYAAASVVFLEGSG